MAVQLKWPMLGIVVSKEEWQKIQYFRAFSLDANAEKYTNKLDSMCIDKSPSLRSTLLCVQKTYESSRAAMV